MRSDLGLVEGVELQLDGLFRCHELHEHGPAGAISAGNRLVEITLRIVSVNTSQAHPVGHREIADALVRLEMVLDVHGLPLGVYVRKGIGSISMHEPVAVGHSTVSEQERDLVNGFLAQGEEVPHHVVVMKARGRISLVRMNERREQYRIAGEEDWRIDAHQIPVSLQTTITEHQTIASFTFCDQLTHLLGVKLDGESSGIPFRVSTTGFAPHQ